MTLFVPLFAALNEGGVRYVAVGGLATVLHGFARLTADVDLMVDVNNAWDANTAIRFGRMIERYEPYWLEEPTPADDVWALGATLYAAVEGRPPYPEQRPRAHLAAEVRYLCHGHTHTALDARRGKTRVINPGALHRAAEYTVALLDTDTDTLTFYPVPRPC